MPWWSVTYLILFAALCAGGIYLDLRRPEPVWYTVGDGVSAVCSITAILAFWSPVIALALGALLFVTTGYALLWDCFSIEHDLRAEFPDPELSEDENRILPLVTTAIVFVFSLPAYYFGFATAYEQLRASAPLA